MLIILLFVLLSKNAPVSDANHTDVFEALKSLESVINKNVVDEITVNPKRKPDILKVLHNLHPDLLSRPADNVNIDHVLPLLESREITENDNNDNREEEENRRLLTWLRNLFNGEGSNKHKKKDIVKSKLKNQYSRIGKNKSKYDKLETRRLMNWFKDFFFRTKTSTPDPNVNFITDATRDAIHEENDTENQLTQMLAKLNNVLEKFNDNIERHSERLSKSMGYVILLPIETDSVNNSTYGSPRRKRELKNPHVAVNKTVNITIVPNTRKSFNPLPIDKAYELNNSYRDASDNVNNRPVDSTQELKDNLIKFVAEMFKEIKLKLEPLKSVKDAYALDDSYIIGYVAASIDTLEMKLTKLMSDMETKKHTFNERQLMELFKTLNMSRTVISKLMDSLQKYTRKENTIFNNMIT